MAWITIPNIFGGKTGAPVTEIDADFAEISTKLNTFNPTGQPFGFTGVSSVRGLVGENNVGAPTTQYDLAAAFVVLRDPGTGALMSQDTVLTLTNDTALAGPIVDGRDQAGAFSASTWVHFYFIGNPTTATVATISSAVAPPTGPALPAGYTAWAYAGAVRFDAGSLLVVTVMRGATMSYPTQVAVLVSTTMAPNTETPIAISIEMPPNALSAQITADLIATNGASNGLNLEFGVVSGATAALLRGVVPNATDPGAVFGQVVLPNVGSQFFIQWFVDVPGTETLVEIMAWVNGFRVANGDA